MANLKTTTLRDQEGKDIHFFEYRNALGVWRFKYTCPKGRRFTLNIREVEGRPRVRIKPH